MLNLRTLQIAGTFKPTWPLIALTALSLMSGIAQAQYQWRDANGQMIISDQPPPASVKPSQIIKSAPMPVAAARPEPKDAKAGAKAPLSSAEKEAEFQKRRKEQAESQKTGVEKQAALDQKNKRCEALKDKLRTLQSDLRLVSVKRGGESAAMEGAEREVEMSKTSRELSTNECG
jgi:Domain of unknown function (DUF4124)